jgi:hypothetical protein
LTNSNAKVDGMVPRLVLTRSALALSVLCGGNVAILHAASPRLNSLSPPGIQRGAEHDVVFSGSNLDDAQEILFYGPGMSVTKVEPKGDAVTAHIQVAPDCPLGEHVVQVRTASGISDYRSLFVGALPAVAEQEPNSDFESPQAIPLNSTVQGVVDNEDVDYFTVDAKQGQRIAVEVEAMRFGTQLFDPYIAIMDAKRFELASADDTPLLMQDAAVAIMAPADGKYVIQVRDSAYGGNGNCRYRLHVGTFPRPTAVYPAGGKVGEEIELQFLGDPAGQIVQKTKLPATPQGDFGVTAADPGGIAPSANPFRLCDQANTLEKEPNNGLAESTPVELPQACNGIIDKPGDVDLFKFSAKQGQVFEVECYARRVRSPLDPVMTILAADGKGIAGDDDARSPDSYLRFTVPADGDYLVQVSDHLGRGGADFVYRVEFQPVVPSLTLGLPRVEQYGQYRQTIMVAKGNRFGALLNASRNNFGGDLVVEGGELPAGVTMTAEPMPAALSSTPVVFEAAADAPLSGRLTRFMARHADPNQNIRGGFTNRADYIIGPPNQSLYRYRDVDQLAIAIVETLPYRLEIAEPKVPIVRNGEMGLKIIAHRQPEFKAAISVELPFRPPGVGASSSITIPEGQNEAVYPLSAADSAALGKWKLFVLGGADVVKGRAWVSSQLATLEVAAPLVTAELQRTSCEQGQATQVYCKLNHATPFEGAAKAQLLGLPAKVTAPDMEFNKDTKELVFAVKTDGESPAGKHGNILCQVTIPLNGELIVGRAGSTELQIDKPLPAPAAAPAAAATAPVAAQQPAQPSEKPLSRLEKLRLSAKDRKG